MLAFSGHQLVISFSFTLHRDTFGCLTFIQKIRLKILCINIKRESLLINIKRSNLTLWKNDATNCSQISWRDWTDQKKCIVSNNSSYFLYLLKRNGEHHLISQMEFVVEMLSALCLTGKPRRRERKARRGQCETEKGGKLRFSLFL